MERDALLAQGTAFLLHDRLTECSDRHVTHVCANPECGSLIACFPRPNLNAAGGSAFGSRIRGANAAPPTVICNACAKAGLPGRCAKITLPYVFIYLANELASMGICVRAGLKHGSFLSG